MAEMEPTRGALTSIFSGQPSSEFQPVLEVRDIRKLQQGTDTRYAVSVTDGEYVVKALAIPGSQLLQMVEAGAVVLNTLIRAMGYRIEQVGDNAFFIIMQADAVGALPEHLRVPAERLQKFPSKQRTGGAEALGALSQAFPAAPGVGAQPGAYNGPGAFTTPDKRAGPGFVEQTPAPQPQPRPHGDPSFGTSAAGAGSAPLFAGSCMPAPAAAPATRSGTIGDFFGRKPVAARASGGFTPIQELSPYTNGRWRIKARVITKSDIRRFTNARGEGQFFKVDLADQSGEMAGTFFGKACDNFYPMLRQGQVYSFSRGNLKPANPRFDRGEYVIFFEDTSVIEAMEDDQEMPGVTYDFKPLCMVPQLEVNTMIDAQAVIYAVQDPFTFTSKKSQKEMVKREIGLWDPSGPDGSSLCNLTIWGEPALENTFEVGAPIFMKAARVTEWNNQKDLASPAVCEVNPDDPRAFALKARYEEHAKTRPMPMTMARGPQSAPGSRKTIQACRDEDLNLGPPLMPGMVADPAGPRGVHRHFVLGTVTSIPLDRMPCYPSCPGLVDSVRPNSAQADNKRTCNKKVTQEGPGLWRCAMGHVCQAPVWRYLCKMQVMDHTDLLEVNVFDDVAKQFFGCEAQEYARIYEDQEQEGKLAQMNGRVLWRRVLLKLRAQKETWQEATSVRYVMDEASGVGVAKDARQMLAEVRSALAAEQLH